MENDMNEMRMRVGSTVKPEGPDRLSLEGQAFLRGIELARLEAAVVEAAVKWHGGDEAQLIADAVEALLAARAKAKAVKP